MICPQCQTENRVNAKFCNECGFSFAQMGDGVAEDKPREKADPRAALKDIPLVEEVDEGFDFTEPELSEAPDRDSIKDVARDMFPDRFDSGRVKAVTSGADVTADLTGLEKLVDSSYIPPAYSGRPGDTMEMPAIGTAAESRDFRAQLSDKERKKLEKQRRKEERSSRSKLPLVLALITLLAAFGIGACTYYLELWGGKSIPDVTGYSEQNATDTLEASGFNPRVELVKSDDVDGIVLLTDPAADSRAEVGSEVVVHVSTSRIVPQILGKQQDEAKEALDAEGFDNYAFVPLKSNEPEGTVLSIDVEQGVRALSTTPMNIEVAVPFTVPEVKDLPQEDAVALLEDEGYQVTVRPHYTEEVKEGVAVSTEPAANTTLNSGETVTLYVTKSRAGELTDLTWSYLTSVSRFAFDGVNYEVSSVDSVTYQGDNVVAYTLTARYYETHYWFGFEAETRYGDYETISGTITWSDSNVIESADPSIKKL